MPARDSSDRTNVDDFHRRYAFLADNGLHRLAEHVGVRELRRLKFGVESSVSIKGTIERWDASIKFSSRDVMNAVLDIQIEAGSVIPGVI